jgi:hypothetical protein
MSDKRKPPRADKLKIDWKAVQKYAAEGTPSYEIAAMIGIDRRTFESACKAEQGMCYREYKRKAMAPKNMELRELLMTRARLDETGAVAIFLAKNRLKYDDHGIVDIDLDNCKTLADKAAVIIDYASRGELSTAHTYHLLNALSKAADIQKFEQLQKQFTEISKNIVTAIKSGNPQTLDALADELQKTLDA